MCSKDAANNNLVSIANRFKQEIRYSVQTLNHKSWFKGCIRYLKSFYLGRARRKMLEARSSVSNSRSGKRWKQFIDMTTVLHNLYHGWTELRRELALASSSSNAAFCCVQTRALHICDFLEDQGTFLWRSCVQKDAPKMMDEDIFTDPRYHFKGLVLLKLW